MSEYSVAYRIKQRYIWLKCIIRKRLLILWDYMYCRLSRSPRIINLEDTLKYIIENNCSVARYGDGEMKFVRGTETLFQKSDPTLRRRLTEILKSHNSHLIVCLPNVFGALDIYRDYDRDYWKLHMAETRAEWYRFIDKDKVYYEAFISRFYMPYRDKSNTTKYVKLWKQIWNDRNLVIVEGEMTRLGVGNDLFDNSNSIKRILCPNSGAFTYYDNMISEVLKFDISHLILLAIGPSATIMASDLCERGYQAIDIGHIDAEYSWYLQKATEKIKIANKYIGEAGGYGGDDKFNDQHYTNEIVAVVHKV